MRRPGAGGREEKKSLAGSRMEEDLSLTSFPGGTEAESKRQRGLGGAGSKRNVIAQCWLHDLHI